jgi:LPXTG-motif cell wall-anchored protein
LATSSGHAAAADAYPALTGVNTITTSTSGVATVELKQPATLSFSRGFFGPARSGVYGKGRIIAMVLEQGGYALARYFGFSDCGSPGCTGDFSFSWNIITAHKLQPGLYHIYVATDGAQVTGVLTLDGPTGAADIPVSPSPGIKVETLAPLIPSTGVADPGLYSASGSETIGNDGGVMLNTLDITTDSVLGGYEGMCLARGAAPPAYVGSCSWPPDREDIANPFLVCDPTGFCDPGVTVDSATQPSQFPWFDVAGADIRPGQADTWGQGNYMEGAMVLGSEASTGLWMSFIPQESPKTASASGTPSAAPAPPPTATPSPTPTGAVQAATNLPNTGRGDDGLASAGLLAGALIAFGTALGVSRRRRSRT